MNWSRRSDFGSEGSELETLRAWALRPDPARPPIDWSVTNPTRAGLRIPDYWAALSRGAREPYEPCPAGLPAARRAVAESYAGRGGKLAQLDPAQVCLLSSTSEAYLHLFQLLCDPGDAVLVPTPSYPLFQQLARAAGVGLEFYSLRYLGDWELDGSSLPSREELAARRVRAIVVVNPNNPTGSVLDAASFESLATLGLPLIVDEVFRPYALGARRLAEAPLSCDLVFYLDGLSKRAAAPGLKLGWIVASGTAHLVREAMQRLEVLADALLATSSAVQHALPAILEREAQAQGPVVARAQENLELLALGVAGSALTLLRPDFGWSAILRIPALAPEETYLRALLARGVWAFCGDLFDLPLSPCLVVSLLVPPEQTRQALARLHAVCAEIEGAA